MADWLLAVVQQSRQNPELKYDRCQQGIQQSLRYGVTCFNDIASDDNSFKALHEEGCRGRVSLEWFHPASQPVVTDSICHRLQAFQASCTSYSSTRLDIGHSPHSLYNVSPQAWQAVCQHFPHLPVHAHLAETRAELDFLAGRPSPLNELHQQLLGQTFPPQSPGNEPITLLQQSGLLQPKTVFAHAVYTTPETRTMLAKASVSIAHCPRSNLWLEGKTLHWPDWENSPTPIGLGTDSCLSNTDLDLRAEARAAMALHGWQAQQAWQIMTLGGATALNLSDHVGQLTPGKCADFVIWQYPKHLMATEASIFDITLSAGTTVAGVYCDGKQIATPQQASAEKW
jgi:cytosine/adenosine deaminase-related metal-dependent hydrolase